MVLTGEADDDPLPAPASLVPAVMAMGEELAAATAELGAGVDLDTLALLGERAATAGLTRHGDRSCGGATRLVPGPRRLARRVLAPAGRPGAAPRVARR